MFKEKPGRKALLLIILTSLIGWLYLAQTTRIASVGHRIQELEKERARLKRENARLLSQIAELESPSRLLARAQEMGFVPLEQVEYVTLPYRHTPAPTMSAEEKPSGESEGFFSKFALWLRKISQ